jgi:hypothetical protein
MTQLNTAGTTSLRFLLITPARNEEAHLPQTIASMRSQRLRPDRWVIINDGSTDKTSEVIDACAEGCDWIERFDMPAHRDRSFAAKAHCFNAVYRQFGAGYEIIGNLDADITFDRPDYLEILLRKFAENPRLGVAGTPFVEEGGYDSTADSFEGEYHVPGGCQLFRRKCFEEIGGYIPNKAGGVDWIAVTTARMKGWQTRSFREARFVHHRKLGTAERSKLSALYSYGQKDYYLGGSPIWEMCRVAYRIAKPPFVLGGVALGLGFLSAAVRRIHRPVSTELLRFHRQEQLTKLRTILRRVALLKRVDNFTVLTEHERVSK